MSEPTDQRLLATMKQALTYHPLSAFPGRCYFAQLPDGAIKIGYSNTVDLMHHRMKMLSRQYGAEVHRLADLPGGFITEALMHERFATDRIPGTGEKFRPSPELMEFIAVLTMNAPVSTASPYRDLAPEGRIFDVTDQQLPAGAILVDHRGGPSKSIPPWLAESVPSWRDDEVPLPDDVADYVGPGQSALPHLAACMRNASSSGVGQSMAEARRELVGVAKVNRLTIERAWRALLDLGRLDPIDWDRPLGRALWVERPGDLP